MRAGVAVSVIGHIGAVIITLVAMPTVAPPEASGSAVVPIEIVDISEEANVRALALDVPDQEENKPDEEEPTEAEPTPAPTPTSAPTPRRQRADEFNLDDIAAGLTNREKERTRRREEGEVADRNQRGAGLGTAETASLEARIASISRQAFNRCWRSVIDLPEPERLGVVLAVRLNRDGSLNGQPRLIRPAARPTFDPIMTEAIRRAETAVRQCDPIESLPRDRTVGERYDLWRDQEVYFGLEERR